MIYRFGDFELDLAMVELREDGAVIAVEPQVFALIGFLLENRMRVVTKEEIVERIWGGRAISDSAITSRIKSARQALSDDGAAQRVIRTIHGVGFRFVGDVTVHSSANHLAVSQKGEMNASEASDIEHTRPSIAVLPFRIVGVDSPQSAIAEALPQDLITELSRLRWLFVIARASAFRFRSEDLDIDRVRTELNVRYCLSGSIEIVDRTMVVSVELSDTHDRGVVWSDRFRVAIGAVHEIREEIVRAVINALELRIPLNEARRARLKAPSRLDAWSAYHLGLQHMYRFNKADNSLATSLFERAVAMEPEFARAYAGLSFTHFQDAFLGYTDETEKASKLAEYYSAQCLERDPIDPFGNLTMGRAHLLRGDLEGCLPWLDRANTLNPNYAQAKYSRGWTQSLLGNAVSCQTDVDEALALSPLDPLLYGMLGVRSFSHMVLGEPAKAVEWAERAARAPSAHVLIELIALVAHGLNGEDLEARAWAESARLRSPSLTKADFLRAFPFRDPPTRTRVLETLERFGF
jgi:TolB-like protein